MTGPTDPPYPGPQDPQYPQQPEPWGGQYPAQYPGPSPAQYPPQYPAQYPQSPQYPSQYPTPSPTQYPTPPPGARGQLLERLGHRLSARPAPRLGITLAGIGVGLGVLGVVVWSTTYIVEGQFQSIETGGGGGSDSRHFLGALLALLVTALGYTLAIRARRGPLATAGIAATALGVPVTMEFLTLDFGHGSLINTDAVVWVSVIVYLISYAFIPGTRGHTFYLGLSLLFIWEYAVDKSAPKASDFLSGAANRVVPGISIGPVPHVGFGTLGGVSLVIGIIYYLLGWGLDRTGRRGAAVAFAVVGFIALAVGIGALAPDFKQVGTGIVLIVAGLALGFYGARYDRRFTTWVWGIGTAFGAVLILDKIVTRGGTSIGIGLIVLGALFVVGGWLLARAINEPDDLPEPEVLPAANAPAA